MVYLRGGNVAAHEPGTLQMTDKATEHQEAATLAGLVYVTDGQPGISRKRSGKGWSFYRPNGKLITDAKERKRILSLAIPPAWTDVWVCPSPKGDIQVTARDAEVRT